jgi:EAL domain-containing protein (putative c-di-GMP-specific phosphodiesterase class I)
LQRALERHELVLHYQPKVRLDDERICGVEALVRWNHPARGLVPPLEFLPLAEETGLIIPIGLWVLRESCRQMREWHDRYPADPPLEISVNVSVRQFRDETLPEKIGQILAETGLVPAALQLEITESVLLEDLDSAFSILTRLKALGVGLKVDDFGTGYSCLQYLSRLPFDTLKIDRSFTKELSGSNGNREIIRMILAMAHHLGMDVIAEGIEQNDQAAELRTLGCEYGQGYYFSKPLAAGSIGTLLAGELSGTAASLPPVPASR